MRLSSHGDKQHLVLQQQLAGIGIAVGFMLSKNPGKQHTPEWEIYNQLKIRIYNDLERIDAGQISQLEAAARALGAVIPNQETSRQSEEKGDPSDL